MRAVRAQLSATTTGSFGLNLLGDHIADLPGFGTNWGSIGELGLWNYGLQLAYTLERTGMIRVTREGSPRGTDPAFVYGSPPQNTLPIDAIYNAYVQLNRDLLFGQISEACRKNVFDKLSKAFSDFDYGDFARYINRTNSTGFLDGTTSQMATSVALAPSQILQGTPPPTIAGIFAGASGMNALTSASLSPNGLTVFFRPSSIDLSNSGVNGYNKALLVHEGLHGYGSYLNQGNFGSYGDRGLLGVFGFTSGPSSQITDYIKKHCF